jgi:hypothetical protein
MGAFMNEAYQAQHGLEPGLFPETVPTYLGHYHLPHTVGDSNVRYVGSPYQGTVVSSVQLLHNLPLSMSVLMRSRDSCGSVPHCMQIVRTTPCTSSGCCYKPDYARILLNHGLSLAAECKWW